MQSYSLFDGNGNVLKYLNNKFTSESALVTGCYVRYQNKLSNLQIKVYILHKRNARNRDLQNT